MNRLLMLALALLLSGCKALEGWLGGPHKLAAKSEHYLYFMDCTNPAKPGQEFHITDVPSHDYLVAFTPDDEWIYMEFPAGPDVKDIPESYTWTRAGGYFGSPASVSGYSSNRKKIVPVFDKPGFYEFRAGYDAETDDPLWVARCAVWYRG